MHKFLTVQKFVQRPVNGFIALIRIIMTTLLNAIFFGCNVCVTQCLKQLDENMKTKKIGRKEK